MELRQLKYFIKAAELQSFSEAARALNIAQSTLSQQVRQLENELGIRLFDRQSNVIFLTEAAVEILPFARRTLSEAESCVAKVNDLAAVASGTLNIGVTYSFSPILTETLIEFTKKYPRVKLNIFYKPMAELMEMLRNRSVDLVLAFRPSARYEDIESHVLFQNHLAVIIKEGHPLAGNSTITFSELSKWPLALPTRGLQARNALDDCLSTKEIALDIRIELNEVNILLEVVKHSSLVSVLAEATVYNQSGVKAIRLRHPDNEMEGCVHVLKNCYRKRSALELIGMLRESSAVRARVNSWLF
ncbi:MAG: LysR substrate-binding domain-containing protein [Muribaculaceae bacterium]|jgi:LysR family cyn operon transcriptional activator|nr:LysR substrate-binding domain-containing protein [Muribaculaceae bacterium]